MGVLQLPSVAGKGSGAGGAGDFEGCYASTGCLMNGVGLHPLLQLEAVQANRFEMYLCRSLERHAQRGSISQDQGLSGPLVRSGSFTFRIVQEVSSTRWWSSIGRSDDRGIRVGVLLLFIYISYPGQIWGICIF